MFRFENTFLNKIFIVQMITIIAAVGQNNELGKDNSIIWHLPDDFKRFKAITTGHHIIMGRKTFESFPKPLPNRTHIVISRQKKYSPNGCVVVDNLQKAIALVPKNEEVFVIGGGEIYTLALPLATKLELTRVFGTFTADTFFPTIDFHKWKLTNEELHSQDEKHFFDFSFETYVIK